MKVNVGSGRRSFNLFLFDLDGTLVSSGGDISAATNRVLVEKGLSPLPEERVIGFVGDGIEEMLRRSFAVHGEELPEDGLSIFRDYYFDHCVDATRPYPGVEEVLDRLSGAKKAIVSNKPQLFTEKIADRLGLSRRFDYVFGADGLGARKPSPEPLLAVMEMAGAGKEETVIVGDGRNDVLAGKAAGVATVAVSYGLTDPVLLVELEPDYLIDDFREILEIIDIRSLDP